MKEWVGRRTCAECQALAAGAGSSTGNSLIDAPDSATVMSSAGAFLAPLACRLGACWEEMVDLRQAHTHRLSSEERRRLRLGDDDIDEAVFGRHDADLHCRLFLGHDVDRVHSYLRGVDGERLILMGEGAAEQLSLSSRCHHSSRLETADYCRPCALLLVTAELRTTVHYYWLLETVQSTTAHCWLLCAEYYCGLLRSTTVAGRRSRESGTGSLS